MKTLVKKMLISVSIILALLTTVPNTVLAMPIVKQHSDSLSFISLGGKIIDKETLKPVMYAYVTILGTSIGTVANTDGEFILKVPHNKPGEQITVSHLGYKTFKTTVNQLQNSNNNIISLEQELVSLKEIIIRIEDPVQLLKGAYTNIPNNYSTQPVMLTSFYRETMKQNKKYVSIAEAVLETNKTSYKNLFTHDRIKVLIGRKSQDVKKMDTVMVKLQGGPLTPFFLDIVKYPENLISEENIDNYDLKLSGQVAFDGKRCYVIDFSQKSTTNEPYFDGKIYIEVESLAIIAAEYSISKYGLEKASSIFVKKKPLAMKFETLGANYMVKYAENNGKWGLNYVRADLKFKCRWKKKLFSSIYSAMIEMAVTECDTINVSKIKVKDMVKESDIFSDKADDFKNDEFWGEYNYIKPDESIQSAIAKLGKLKKN
jgi:hypothetical protein